MYTSILLDHTYVYSVGKYPKLLPLWVWIIKGKERREREIRKMKDMILIRTSVLSAMHEWYYLWVFEFYVFFLRYWSRRWTFMVVINDKIDCLPHTPSIIKYVFFVLKYTSKYIYIYITQSRQTQMSVSSMFFLCMLII